MPSPYNHRWRNVTRPHILRRAGGRFSELGEYCGAAKCERCRHIDCMHDGRSELDVAHLEIQPGEDGHDGDENLAALCRKCHRAHDYDSWARKFRAYLQRRVEELRERLDSERPILQQLKEAV